MGEILKQILKRKVLYGNISTPMKKKINKWKIQKFSLILKWTVILASCGITNNGLMTGIENQSKNKPKETKKKKDYWTIIWDKSFQMSLKC